MDDERGSGQTMVIAADEYRALVERVRKLEEEVRRLRKRLENADAARGFGEGRVQYRVREGDLSLTEEERVRPSERQVDLLIPESVLFATNMSVQDLKVELAVHLFEQEWLTLGQAARLAEMHVGDFMQLLAQRGVSLHYDVEEFKEDVATLKRLNLL